MNDITERTLFLRDWQTPATNYEEREVGNFRLKKGKYSRGGMYPYWGMDGYLFFKCVNTAPIMMLQEKVKNRWGQWMVDDPPQQRAMEIYCKAAKGEVLCAGLGLGLMLHELAKNKKVTHVVTVERSQEVIDLVWDYCPYNSMTLVVDDFWEFVEKSDTQWDMILVDLWVSSCKEDKIRIFNEIVPSVLRLILKWPNTKLVVHGFQTLSDVKPVSKEMIKLITDLQIYGR